MTIYEESEIGKIKLRTKITSQNVLPEEIEQRELVLGNYEKNLWIKDYDGTALQFLPVDDDEGAESTYKSWSSYRTKQITDAIVAEQGAHDHDDRYYRFTQVNSLIETRSPLSHDHDSLYHSKAVLYTITEVDILISNKADITHNHDDRYYTINQLDFDHTGKMDKISGGTHDDHVLLSNSTGNAKCSDIPISEFVLFDVVLDDLDNFNSADFVHTSGNESIDGTKTFNSLPLIPIIDPSQDEHTASKKWIDYLFEEIDGGTF